MSGPSRDAEAQQLLESICLPLGLEPTAAQTAALLGYLDLLARWNSTYNLTSVRDRAGMLTQHLADCLAAVPPLTRHLAQTPEPASVRVLDVGSGGGLPGCVFATLLPQVRVTCVDSVGKKAAFVRQVAGALGLANLAAVHARVEHLKLAPFDIVTSRAFSSLDTFTRLTLPLLAPSGVWMAMKGKTPDEELQGLSPGVRVFHVEQLSVPGLQADRCLVWLRRSDGAA